jgi:hypothetical protein
VTTYDVGSVREFERSARAHATVSVDGEGPDELWASFRVGGRGRVAGALARTTPEGVRILAGSVHAWQGWRHRRQILYWPGEALLVLDRVSGASGVIRSHVPFDVSCSVEGGTINARCAPLVLNVLRGFAASTVAGREHPRDGWVSDGFARPLSRPAVAIHADGDGEVAYAIAARGCTVMLSDDGCTIRGQRGEVRVPLEELA